jgi:ABC-type proline/glycine betaine transport system permease subunit
MRRILAWAILGGVGLVFVAWFVTMVYYVPSVALCLVGVIVFGLGFGWALTEVTQ